MLRAQEQGSDAAARFIYRSMFAEFVSDVCTSRTPSIDSHAGWGLVAKRLTVVQTIEQGLADLDPHADRALRQLFFGHPTLMPVQRAADEFYAVIDTTVFHSGARSGWGA